MTIHFKLSYASEVRLITVKPVLIDIVRAALVKSFTDFAVTEGVRTKEHQEELYAQGRTKPGNIVTWTKNSKHITGDAVDLVPINPDTKKLDWNYKEGFLEIARCMKAVSEEKNVKLRWGYDWDMDGNIQEKGEYDGPHWELA